MISTSRIARRVLLATFDKAIDALRAEIAASERTLALYRKNLRDKIWEDEIRDLVKELDVFDEELEIRGRLDWKADQYRESLRDKLDKARAAVPGTIVFLEGRVRDHSNSIREKKRELDLLTELKTTPIWKR